MCYLLSDSSPEQIEWSDRQHYTCTTEGSSLDYDLYQLSFERYGTVFRCHKFTQTNQYRDARLEYPDVVKFIDDIVSTPDVTCVPVKSTLERVANSASKGYFLASNVESKKKYICLDIIKNNGSNIQWSSKAY